MRAFVVSVALLFLLVPSARADDAVLIDGVAARVDDTTIFVSAVRARMHGPFENRAAATKAMHVALESIIDAMLIAKRAQELHIDVSADEVSRAREAVTSRNGFSAADLSAALRKEGMTEAAWEATLREQILEGKVLRQDIGVDVRPSNPDELEAWVLKRRNALLQRLRAEALVEVRL
jgi:parvulin-like peptidyl-prolyl isomerase